MAARRAWTPLVLTLVAACSIELAVPGATVDAPHADARTADGPRDGGASITYSTQFDGTESPISEGGAWAHTGLDWTIAETAGGIAYGTQTGTHGYDDSYAYLSLPSMGATRRSSGGTVR